MRRNDCNHDFVRRKDTCTCTKKRQHGNFLFQWQQRGNRLCRFGMYRFNPRFYKPGEDPQHYNIIQARKHGAIIGNFDTGDQVAIVLSEDKKRVVRAIDLSSLIGRWLTGDSIGDPAATGFTLGEDGYAGTITTKPERLRYKNWDIKNAKLVLTKCDAMLAHPVLYYDTFNIVSLEQDTLFLRPEGKWTRTKYVKSTIDK